MPANRNSILCSRCQQVYNCALQDRECPHGPLVEEPGAGEPPPLPEKDPSREFGEPAGKAELPPTGGASQEPPSGGYQDYGRE